MWSTWDHPCCHRELENYDDVIKWKHLPRYWSFERGFHQSPVNSPHKGLWRGALMFSLICTWINGWVNNREAGHLRRGRARYDVFVMYSPCIARCYYMEQIVVLVFYPSDPYVLFQSLSVLVQILRRIGTLWTTHFGIHRNYIIVY